MHKTARFLRRLRVYLHHRLSPWLPRSLRAGDAAFGAELRFVSDPVFRITEADIARSRGVQPGPGSSCPTTATWFLPPFYHVTYGGLLTIFRFMSGFADRGMSSRVVVFGDPLFNAARARDAAAAHFPNLAHLEITVLGEGDRVEDLPRADVAFCTWWHTAYLLLRYNQTGRKFYLVQDFEPSFYEAGSRHALAESTYRFGFFGIANTPGVLAAIADRYGMEGVSFLPAVDGRCYFPPATRRRDGPVRVFFYCRPQSRRNAFELGVLTIEELLRRYPGGVEVVTAGEDWDEADYGLGGRIRNLGLLSTPAEVGALYRSCDVGFVFMLSKHPSYQPLEFMACGMAVVANRNEDNLWLLRDGENCLLAEPSPTAMAEAVGRLIDDAELRAALCRRGLTSVNSSWNAEIDRIWNILADPEKGRSPDRTRPRIDDALRDSASDSGII